MNVNKVSCMNFHQIEAVYNHFYCVLSKMVIIFYLLECRDGSTRVKLYTFDIFKATISGLL